MEIKFDLTVEGVAQFAGCHRSTVLKYERDGYLKPLRDCNNYRRYSQQDAHKLKKLLDIRRPAN